MLHFLSHVEGCSTDSGDAEEEDVHELNLDRDDVHREVNIHSSVRLLIAFKIFYYSEILFVTMYWNREEFVFF